jgi:snurportin-1
MLSLYKAKGSSLADQNERRKELLARQRDKRESIVSQLRFGETSESTGPEPPIGLMLAEWLFYPSEEMSSWFVVGCPLGQRCLVVVGHSHRTLIYNRHGRLVRTLKTSLPRQTILYCIFDHRSSIYHLLDLLMWNGQDYSTDMECQCRFFMLDSLVGDRRLSTNFAILPRRTVADEQWPLAEDGYLFYHPLGFYQSGYSPLVCWLKPFMVNEILHRSIHGEKNEQTPTGYTTAHAYMFAEQTKRKEME